jgi:hypothetical protein
MGIKQVVSEKKRRKQIKLREKWLKKDIKKV